MKDLGPLQYFFRLEVQPCSKSTLLHQHKYTQELLSLAGFQDNNSVLTPIEVNLKLHKANGDPLSDPSMYWQLVGNLNYLTSTWYLVFCLANQSIYASFVPDTFGCCLSSSSISQRDILLQLVLPFREFFTVKRALMMPTRLVVWILIVLLWVGACSLAMLSFLKRVRSRFMSQSHPLSLNIELYCLTVLKLYGFTSC